MQQRDGGISLADVSDKLERCRIIPVAAHSYYRVEARHDRATYAAISSGIILRGSRPVQGQINILRGMPWYTTRMLEGRACGVWGCRDRQLGVLILEPICM